MTTGRVWTEDEVIALGVRCSVEDAASVLGLGKHKAYRLLREGEFPLPFYEVDGRKWVPTRPIRELLGIEPPKDCPLGTRLSQGGNGEDPAATRVLASVPEPLAQGGSVANSIRR